MSVVLFNDISENNGAYNMDTDTNPAIAMRVSTGELMRFDHEASRNYANAIRTGKVPILYHYAGNNDPVQEAELFLAAVAPLAGGDIYDLDAELGQSREWKQAFIDHVRSKTDGTSPWDYMNQSTTKALGGPIDGCALWLAAPDWGFSEDVPGVGVYMAQQGPIVNGHDTNAFFGTLEQLKAYGYHAQQASITPDVPAPPAPDPAPQPEPVVVPEPVAVVDPTPAPAIPLPGLVNNVPTPPVVEPVTPVQPPAAPAQVVVVATPHQSFWQKLAAFIGRLLKRKG